MSGNGVDIAAVYLLLREVADTVIQHDGKFTAIDRQFDGLDRKFEDPEPKFDDLRSQVSGLRQTVIEYRASVMRRATASGRRRAGDAFESRIPPCSACRPSSRAMPPDCQ